MELVNPDVRLKQTSPRGPACHSAQGRHSTYAKQTVQKVCWTKHNSHLEGVPLYRKTQGHLAVGGTWIPRLVECIFSPLRIRLHVWGVGGITGYPKFSTEAPIETGVYLRSCVLFLKCMLRVYFPTLQAPGNYVVF